MDSGATIVALLFVIAIFSSFGNKGYHQPVPTSPAAVQQQIGSIKFPNPSITDEAEVVNLRQPIHNFIAKYRNPDETDEITGSIIKYSQSYNVNPKLVTALMARESRFNPRAVSSSNAKGLGQLLPSTCKSVSVDDPYDIDQNAKGTVRYMKYLLDRFSKYDQQVALAIASYLEGPNQVERNLSYSPHTAQYVQDIMTTYNQI